MPESPAVILYDSAGNPVAIELDGSLYRLAILGKVQDSAGTIINPVTKEQLPAGPGQAAMAASLPVVLASDQPPVATIPRRNEASVTLREILHELKHIRTLLEVISDEKMTDQDLS